MAFEIILMLVALGVGIFLIGIPFYRLVKSIVPTKRDPLKEAQERLEQARLETEAAKLNKQTERLYDTIYTEALQEEYQLEKKEMRIQDE